MARHPRCSTHPGSGLLCRATRVVWMIVLVAMAVLAAAPSARGQSAVEPPLVVDGDAEDGQVTVEPATQTVVAGRVAWLLTNGGTDPLTFEVSIRDVVATDDGVELGEPHPDLGLAVGRLRLAAGEVARVPLQVPDEVRGAFALVARTVDADPETTVSGVALRTADVAVAPTVTAADAMAGTFTVRLDADGPSLVDVALRSQAWPGLAGTETLVEGVLVPPGGRDLEVAVDGMLAGRVRLDVAVAPAVAGDAATERTSRWVWWWPPPAIAGLAGVVVVVGAIVGVRRSRRVRTG